MNVLMGELEVIFDRLLLIVLVSLIQIVLFFYCVFGLVDLVLILQLLIFVLFLIQIGIYKMICRFRYDVIELGRVKL